MSSYNSITVEDDELFDPGDFFLAPSPAHTASASSVLDHSRDVTSDSECVSTPESNCRGGTDIRISDPSAQEFPTSGFNPKDFVALGAIRLHEHAQTSQTYLQGLPDSEDKQFPHSSITVLTERGVLISQPVDHPKLESYSCLRIWILPEDCGRRSSSNVIRDNRRYIRRLLRITDISSSAWHGSYDPGTPAQTHLSPPDDSESLFHIFNTLNSPCHGQERSEYASAATSASLDELRTPMYPYQNRSVLAMLRRETKPARSVDPRKPQHYDMLGRPFYMDVHEGTILTQPHLYEESRGGVLAETMGYGKTLICLALICATRGHYPSVPYGRLDIKAQPREHTATLLEMAATATRQLGVPWKAEFHQLAKEGYNPVHIVAKLRKQRRQYIEPIFQPTNPMRKGKRLAEKIVNVSYTTLVVVPQNLLIQWQQEIKRHLSADALDVLIIEPKHTPLPPSSELMKHDLVLITKTRLEQEYRDDDLHNGKRRKGDAIFESPLTELRWLRVICDEGHAFAGSTSRTNAQAMLDKMYIERRWVVSGTPSHSLVGVEVGIAANTDSYDSRETKINKSLQSQRAPSAMLEEAKDVDRLRQLIVGFLAIPPWANKKGADHANWKKYLTPFDSRGHRRKTASLRTLLQSVVVRHKIQDIDADLELPSLFNKVIYLEPSFYDKMSLNLFTMLLSANAVTSERTDEDYLFHMRNRKQLEVLIKNLRQASFHWVGVHEELVVETLKTCNKYLDGHLDNISDTDGMLITEAILNGEKALGNAGWLAFSTLHEIGVYIDNFPAQSAEFWSLNRSKSSPLLVGVQQASALRQYVEEHFDDPMSGMTGAGIREINSAQARVNEQGKPKKTASDAQVTGEPSLKVQTGRPLVISSVKRNKRASGVPQLPAESPLRRVNVVGFSSAKLTYLVDQVLQHKASDKIIIFYDSGNVAFWLAEALQLLSVDCLIYASSLTVARRATYLATFNESDEFRVLLMDLGQAALGLHVACASRIYIVSPIWQPNIESQAIKRAHRIGQTKPVYVETLVLRGTLEEKMIQRRQQMDDSELRKAAKNLLDDGPMSRMIKGLRFLKFSPDEEGPTAQMATLNHPRPLFDRVSRPIDHPEQGLLLVDDDVVGPKKKRQKKTVRIASPSPSPVT